MNDNIQKSSLSNSLKITGLSATALYTCGVWNWGKLPRASLFYTNEVQAAFSATNFALAFARFLTGQPSLKHSLLHRHVMINKWLAEKEALQIIELGAGLSPRGAHLTDNSGLVFTEIDLPEVIDMKRAILSGTEEGRNIIRRPNLKFISADVFNVDLKAFADSSMPIYIVAEGLFMYFGKSEQISLWSKVNETISVCGSGGFIFDLVPWVEQPSVNTAGRALEFLMKRFTQGRSFIRDNRTRYDIREELYKTGFKTVTFLEPSSVAGKWTLPFPDRKTQQLLFACEV